MCREIGKCLNVYLVQAIGCCWVRLHSYMQLPEVSDMKTDSVANDRTFRYWSKAGCVCTLSLATNLCRVKLRSLVTKMGFVGF